jgi:choice-of-anchor C domain-containing protein
MRFALLLLRLAVILGFPGLPGSANLIVNGSFEESSVNPGSYQDLPAGSTAIKGWTVTQHIDYVNGLWLASDGKHSLDLEGSACNTGTTTGCLGGVKQTFATVPGQKYNVSFDLSGNPYNGPKIKTLKVSAAGQNQSFTFDLTGHSVRSMGWKTEYWTFTAMSAQTTLEFDSADNIPNLSGWGPALDNVIVTPATGK